MEKIRVGVIGVGFIGRVHIEALRRLGYVEVTALVSRKQATADALAAELSIPKAYGGYEELFGDPEIDAVHITTVNNLHAPLALKAMKAGKHVLCDKPLAMNSGEARGLLDAAREAGVAHAVCHNKRYYPMVKHARAMRKAGELGEIRLVHGHYLQDWLFLQTDYNWRLVGSIGGRSRAVADIGTHWMDMVQHVTGQRIVSVLADLTTFIPRRVKPKGDAATYTVRESQAGRGEEISVDTEDHATVMLRFSGGAKGAMIVCQVCAGRKNYIHWEIDGSGRSLEWNGEEPNTLWIGERGKPNAQLIKDPTLIDPEAARYAGAPCGLAEGYLDTFKGLFGDFYAWIRSGRPMDMQEADFPTFLTGLNELDIVEVILESAETGRWVDVNYSFESGPEYL